MRDSSLQVVLLTTLAMIAFASNSLLNRLALGQRAIDPASYTTIRLTSGAVMLFVLASRPSRQNKKGQPILRGSGISAALLFLYAITFSFAYLSLNAGTGALILFGTVQVTMLLMALWRGERPQLMEWVGLCLALSGLVYLVFPGLAAPSLLGSALMLLAGMAWGLYSIRGRGSIDPLADTAGNFVYSVPMVLLILLIAFRNIQISTNGILLAALSGALASGLGYVIWYAALKGLTATRAAIVQLSVPVIAAWGGVLLLDETISTRLFIAGQLILGGIGLSVLSRGKS